METEEASDLFWSVFTEGGGCRSTCDCGREHVALEEGWDWEEGEYEKLEDWHCRDPDKVIMHDYSSTYTTTLFGKFLVADCKCGQAKKFEDMIWAWRHHTIPKMIEYIHERAKKMRAEAEVLLAMEIMAMEDW